jgi:hypothetical protein
MKTVLNTPTQTHNTRTSSILKLKWRRQFLNRIRARDAQPLDKEDQHTWTEEQNSGQ